MSIQDNQDLSGIEIKRIQPKYKHYTAKTDTFNKEYERTEIESTKK